MWIDSHCHLTHERIAPLGTPEEIVAQARAAHIDGMLNICCRIADEFPIVLKTAQKFNDVWCTIGTHPHDAGLEAEKAITQDKLVELACSDPKIVGIGETGLDYFYNNSSHEDQQESFRKHIRAALEADLPLIIHTRDADEDILRLLQEEGSSSDGKRRVRGVLHCFSSGAQLAQKALDFGFYISFSGILTFKQAGELREIAKTVPLNRILVETDAPFLAPTPHRGSINQPAYVSYTGTLLAELHGTSEEELASHSKNNFFTLFDKAEKS